jgi:hypothetical protein
MKNAPANYNAGVAVVNSQSRRIDSRVEGARGPFLTSPLGTNFDPRGGFVPQGWILSPGGERRAERST